MNVDDEADPDLPYLGPGSVQTLPQQQQSSRSTPASHGGLSETPAVSRRYESPTPSSARKKGKIPVRNTPMPAAPSSAAGSSYPNWDARNHPEPIVPPAFDRHNDQWWIESVAKSVGSSNRAARSDASAYAGPPRQRGKGKEPLRYQVARAQQPAARGLQGSSVASNADDSDVEESKESQTATSLRTTPPDGGSPIEWQEAAAPMDPYSTYGGEFLRQGMTSWSSLPVLEPPGMDADALNPRDMRLLEQRLEKLILPCIDPPPPVIPSRRTAPETPVVQPTATPGPSNSSRRYRRDERRIERRPSGDGHEPAMRQFISDREDSFNPLDMVHGRSPRLKKVARRREKMGGNKQGR